MAGASGGNRLPSALPRLRSLSLSPFLHLAANLGALTWLVVVETRRNAFESLFATVGITTATVAQTAPTSDLVAGIAFLPLILSILLDLVASTQINAAILEYNGLAKASVARARGGVQGDISILPDAEKEAIFGILEGWELKSLKDNFAFLSRQISLAVSSLLPWLAVLVTPALAIGPAIPTHLVPQMLVVIAIKGLILFYWLITNLRTRSVRLRLFQLE